MINALALNLVANVMSWDTERATEEYAWLRLVSAMKYDGYSDFRAGARFLESLVSWLRQFDSADREDAYDFVKKRLVYISALEMQRIIENFVPETVSPYLRRSIACEMGVPHYDVWKTPEGASNFKHKFRRCLFVGMSDGSRIDILRRTNSGRISQEQVVPMMNVDDEKWKRLNDDLKKEQGNDAKFDNVYLIDDFTASGTTFIRFPDGKPKGKLANFNQIVTDARERLSNRFPLSIDYTLHIHHYVSTAQARGALEMRINEAKTKLDNRSYGSVKITEGMLLPNDIRVANIDKEGEKVTPTRAADKAIVDISKRYYDHGLFGRLEKHCREAGQSDMRYGYANCALPVVLEHNTPNNSIPLLWAETDGESGKEMHSLFYRRDRHG
jgi:hypothetical protein